MKNMKKLCLLVLCFSISIVAYSQTIQRTILSHEGNLTQYNAAHWQDAFTDAVDGDIIYFTPGVFPGNLEITKSVSLIGAGISSTDCFHDNQTAMDYSVFCTTGQSTSIQGAITIAIPGSKTLTSPIMEGIRVTGAQSITQPVTNLTFKRCQFGEQFSASATVTNLRMESCFVTRLFGTNVESANFYNCYLEDLGDMWSGEGKLPAGTGFTNCHFGMLRTLKDCTLIKCIVHRNPDQATSITYKDCILCGHFNDPGSMEENCVHKSNDEVTNDLITNSYPGIGPFYGTAPFSFKPSQSYVSSSTLNYNSSTKKLNVTMTIKKGE